MKDGQPAQPTWYGEFCWHGEYPPIKLYCTSPSIEQAFRFFCKRISEKLGHKTSNEVRHYFYDTNKYTIREVKKK